MNPTSCSGWCPGVSCARHWPSSWSTACSTWRAEMATAPRPRRSMLSLQEVALVERRSVIAPACLDLDLTRSEVALVQVDDEVDAAALVDLVVGLVDPAAGLVRFRGVDWRTRTPR